MRATNVLTLKIQSKTESKTTQAKSWSRSSTLTKTNQ